MYYLLAAPFLSGHAVVWSPLVALLFGCCGPPSHRLRPWCCLPASLSLIGSCLLSLLGLAVGCRAHLLAHWSPVTSLLVAGAALPASDPRLFCVASAVFPFLSFCLFLAPVLPTDCFRLPSFSPSFAFWHRPYILYVMKGCGVAGAVLQKNSVEHVWGEFLFTRPKCSILLFCTARSNRQAKKSRDLPSRKY